MEGSTKKLSTYPEGPIADLKGFKKAGGKVVGYVCNGFMPQELVRASGAIPVGLNRGGDYNAVLKSTEFLPRFFDAYSRSQIGYWAMEDTLYRLADLFVVPCTDKNIEAIADCWEVWTDIRLFKLGVPHNNTSEYAFKYYVDGLLLLKEELEKLTGNLINPEKLRREIDSSNKMRLLIKQISELRKSERPLITGKEFIKLNHASFYTDTDLLIQDIGQLFKELRSREGKKGPRIFLIGSSIAEGDYKVYDILEKFGANVVIEEFSEGIQPYRGEVENSCNDSSLIEALADFYFRKRIPLPALFRPATEERYAFTLKLAEEFKVDGIIWYSMQYREAYDIEGVYFGRKLQQDGIPFIKIITEYNPAEYHSLQTRIGAFIESIVGR